MPVIEKILSIAFGAIGFAGWSFFIYPNFGAILGREPGPTDYLIAGLVLFSFVAVVVWVIMHSVGRDDGDPTT